MPQTLYISPDELFSIAVPDPEPVTGAPDLDQVLLGFDARPLPSGISPTASLWRIGHWLRARGARRPRAVRVVAGGAVIVDDRVLTIDGLGLIEDLSSAHRATRATSPAWKHS